MKNIDYCYWLQGYFESSKMNASDEKVLGLVKNRLQLVFTKVTSGEKSVSPTGVKLTPKEFIDWLRGYLDAIKISKALSPLVEAIYNKLSEIKEAEAQNTNEDKFKEYLEILRKNGKPTYLRDHNDYERRPLELSPKDPIHPTFPIMCDSSLPVINAATSITC